MRRSADQVLSLELHSRAHNFRRRSDCSCGNSWSGPSMLHGVHLLLLLIVVIIIDIIDGADQKLPFTEERVAAAVASRVRVWRRDQQLCSSRSRIPGKPCLLLWRNETRVGSPPRYSIHGLCGE